MEDEGSMKSESENYSSSDNGTRRRGRKPKNSKAAKKLANSRGRVNDIINEENEDGSSDEEEQAFILKNQRDAALQENDGYNSSTVIQISKRNLGRIDPATALK